MPFLGDYLGQLLSEITLARLHADLETVRLAELYASHPLLRHLPVPHVRLPEVELEVPVVIRQSEEPRTGESPRGGVKVGELRQAFDRVLEAHLASTGAPLARAVRERLKSALDDRAKSLDQPSEIAIDIGRVAEEFTATAMRIMSESEPRREVPPPTTPREASPAPPPSLRETDLRETAKLAFLKLRKPPPRLLALVTSSEIREAGPAESLTRLRLKVTEQGVEWTTIEFEGKPVDRLVPE